MIVGLILAGGEGRRMGDVPKPEVRLGDMTLISHVIERLKPQTDELFISGRQSYGTSLTYIPDLTSDFTGPVGGLHASFKRLISECHDLEGVLVVPCDVPFLPNTLLEALKDDRVSAAHDGDRLHPTLSWWPRKGVEAALKHIEGSDIRSLHGLLELCNVRAVSFTAADDFFNINTPEDLKEAALKL